MIDGKVFKSADIGLNEKYSSRSQSPSGWNKAPTMVMIDDQKNIPVVTQMP